MAGSKTQYLSRVLLDHVLCNNPYTPPETFYIALSLEAFDPTSTGVAMSEIDVATCPSYARVAVDNDQTQLPLASDALPSVKAFANDITFPTASEDWGLPLSVYVCANATGGSALYGADLTAEDEIASGDTFKIPAGTFVFSED